MEEKLDDYTQDGSVNLRGKPVSRSRSGGWRACSYIVVYEVFERMAYYGISSNLVVYLTEKLHQGTVKSANNVTNWVGTIWITPVVGAYIADAHLGRFWTFMIASVIYLAGMGLLTFSVSLPALRPPECKITDVVNCKKASKMQLSVFFGALYTLAVGTGGTKPNISTIGADQFDDFDPRERKQKLSFFNWWMFSIFFGTFFANTVLVYIQDNVGWALGYGIPTSGLLISIIIFLAGTPIYRHRVPAGRSVTEMAKLIVANLRKWNVKGRHKSGEFNETESSSSLKQMLKMIPILATTIIPSTMLAQINTLFVKQGMTLNRRVGSFTIPPASLQGFVTLSMLISVVVYDRFFVPMMRRWTKNPRGITLLQRMGIGMVFHIIIMATASLVDKHRLNMARHYGVVESGAPIPLSIFVLLPQFILMGVADSFLEVAKIEFFYDQAPEGMKSLGTSYSMTSLGIGCFTSSFLLSTVTHLTKRNGHRSWILNNLNASHLDYYYAFFAILNCVNFFLFLGLAKVYVYRDEVFNEEEK